MQKNQPQTKANKRMYLPNFPESELIRYYSAIHAREIIDNLFYENQKKLEKMCLVPFNKVNK